MTLIDHSLEGPNGGTLSDEAGLDDMVNLANSHMQEPYHHRSVPDHEVRRREHNEDNFVVPVFSKT